MAAIAQYLKSDCGAVCLKYVAHHYGISASVPQLRRLAGTTPAGTTLLGIVQAAGKLGLTAKGIRGDRSTLETCPKPAIAHVRLSNGGGHYLVVLRCRKNRVRIFDPVAGRKIWYAAEAFAETWSGLLVLLAPGPALVGGNAAQSPIARLLAMLLDHKAAFAQVLLGAVLTSALGIAMSFYVQHVVDDVIPNGNGRLLDLLGIAMIVLIAARLVVGFLQYVLSAKLAQRMDIALVLGYYRHLLRLPQSFFDTMRVGEMTSRIGDAIQIRSFLGSAFVGAILNPTVIALCFGAMFFYSGRLALLTLAQLPLQLGVYLMLNRVNRKYQRATKERSADLNSHVTEVLHMVSTVKRHGLESAVAIRTENAVVRLMRVTWAAGLEGFVCASVSGIGSQLYSLGMLWYGASLVLRTSITPGELMSCYTLAMYLAGGLAGLVSLSSDLQQTLIAADRLFEIMDEELEPRGGSVALTPETMGPISFKDVVLRHPGRMPALRGVTFAIPAGRITAITGESGSGKSTLLAILQRLYVPDSGLIKVGRIDFDYIGTASLRAMVSVLPQRVDLFSGSLLANIAAGEADPDMARVVDVCSKLGMAEFVDSLPEKFNTWLGEGGLNFSGGQRQKVGLARAFYRHAPILLLDEPTTALDWQSTQKVAAILEERRREGATIVVVTHSRAIRGIADAVVLIREGVVVPESAADGRAPDGLATPSGMQIREEPAPLPLPLLRQA